MNPLYTWVGKQGFAIATRGSTSVEMNPLMPSMTFMYFGLTLGCGE
jgi:hypothetical protein